MVENFFQERFNKNLKFYEGKTTEELKQKYELLYGGLELKDVYLSELAIIKKLLNKEKISKKDNTSIDFEEYIEEIEELYSKIENMTKSELLQNKEKIELIIVSTKLSLNSPIYFVVDVDKLKNYHLSTELNEFIKDEKSKRQETNNELIKLKKVLTQEIEKKQNQIDSMKTQIRTTETLKKFEELYWKLFSNNPDPYDFLIQALQLDFNKKEKKTILDITNKMVQHNDKRSIEQFNRKISFLVSDFKNENNLISASIVDIERGISMITKISQNIDENGHFIQCISDDVIDEYINQIKALGLNIVPLMHQIIKEQTYIARKQKIEKIVHSIENKSKALSRKIKPVEKKTSTLIPEEYKNLLLKAKNIVENISYDLELDELETLIVEDLRNKNVDEKIITETIKSASSETCRMKFIVHGLSYQIANIDQINLTKSVELISLYITYFESCSKKLEEEKTEEQAFNKKISVMQEEITKIENEIEEDILEQLDENKIKSLNSYVKVEIDSITIEEENMIDDGLSQFNLDITTLKLYKAYTVLKETISETKLFIEMINEEKTTELLKQVEEKITLISSLLKQYKEAKRIYEEMEKIKAETIKQTNDNYNDNDNILIYFETEDGKTQVEERVSEDFKKYGKYTQTDISVIQELIKTLKEGNINEIYTTSDNINPFDNSYKKRRLKKGDFRIAYLPLNSSALKTDKPVYLVISAGKKLSSNSDVYTDANHLKDKVLGFISSVYERLTTQEAIQTFLERQKVHEQNIMKTLTNERGKLNANTSFKK